MQNYNSIRQLADKITQLFNFKLSTVTFHSRRMRSGFTLIELVVVMAIIAVLAAAVGVNFFTALNKGRDSRRKQDLQAVAKALELYYNDHNAYPTPPLPNWGERFVHEENDTVVYMAKLPIDPTYPNATYCYESDGLGSYYKLYSNLENLEDPQILSDQLCGTDGLLYNYTIMSTNIEG